MSGAIKTPGVFYGWYIVALATVANFMSVGSGFYIFNAFMEPLCELRGWTRTDVNIALMIGMFGSGLMSFFYGILLPKIGCRILMSVGPLIGGLALIFLFHAESLWLFNIICALLFLANASYGGIVSVTVVNNWFVEKRGKAMGTSMAGVSLSGATLPFIAMILSMNYGLTVSAACIGFSVMLLSPAAWLVIRDWPEQRGLSPDGVDKKEVQNYQPEYPGAPRSRIFKLLVKDKNFWKLGASVTLMMSGVVGVMSQLKPRFADIGFGDTTAMLLMMSTAFMGAVGKYVSGRLYDRFSPVLISAFLALANIAGFSLALISHSLWSLSLFILIFGFSMGGTVSISPIMTAYLFGRENFSKVYKYIILFLTLDLPGMFIAARSFDLTGSYDTAYVIYIVFDIFALLIVLSLKPAPLGSGAEFGMSRRADHASNPF